jgi:hypothetical protein
VRQDIGDQGHSMHSRERAFCRPAAQAPLGSSFKKQQRIQNQQFTGTEPVVFLGEVLLPLLQPVNL